MKFALALLVGLSGVAKADTLVAHTARNQRGAEVHPLFAGFAATRIAEVPEQMVCTGHCVLGGLVMGTGNAGQEVYLFDTGAAHGAAVGGTYMKLKQRFYFDTQPARDRVPLPIRFNNGISIRLSSIAAGEQVTVLYLDLDPL